MNAPLMPPDEIMQQSAQILDKIRPLIAGREPELQGWVLTELLAVFLQGFKDRDARIDVIESLLRAARALIDLFDEIEAKPGGQPQ